MSELKKELRSKYPPFTLITNPFITDKRLATSSKWLFVILCYHADRRKEEQVVWPSYERLQELTGMSRTTISNSIQELEKLGWISKKKRFSGSTIYTLEMISQNSSSPENGLMDSSSPQSDTTGSPENGLMVVQKMDSNKNHKITRLKENKSKGEPQPNGCSQASHALHNLFEPYEAIGERNGNGIAEGSGIRNGELKPLIALAPLSQVKQSELITISKEKPKKKVKEASEDGLKFVEWFNELLPEEVRAEKPSVKNLWGLTYDALIRIDKKEHSEIVTVCEWARSDEFWKKNFFSPTKLRESSKSGIMRYNEFLYKVNQGRSSYKYKPGRVIG